MPHVWAPKPVLTHPRPARTRRSRGARPVPRTFLPEIGLARNARHRSVSAVRKSGASISRPRPCGINGTLTLPEHEEGAKEAFEGPGFRRRAQVE